MPFMPNATSVPGCIASATGMESAYPSTELDTTSSAPGLTPARRRRCASGTPVHFAFEMSLPPTWLLMHSSVRYCSTAGMALSSR